MGLPAAKKGDLIMATDTHIVMVPTPPGSSVPTPLPHPFMGMLDDGLSTNVNIMGQPAATVDSMASNQPPHIPTPPGAAFQKAPATKAAITAGSTSVKLSGKAAARSTDPAATCNDPVDLP